MTEMCTNLTPYIKYFEISQRGAVINLGNRLYQSNNSRGSIFVFNIITKMELPKVGRRGHPLSPPMDGHQCSVDQQSVNFHTQILQKIKSSLRWTTQATIEDARGMWGVSPGRRIYINSLQPQHGEWGLALLWYRLSITRQVLLVPSLRLWCVKTNIIRNVLCF